MLFHNAKLACDQMKAAFFEKFGVIFDEYHLTDTTRTWARAFFHGDAETGPSQGFVAALKNLGIESGNITDIYLPWWNEKIAIELNYSTDSSGASTEITSSHSFLNQLARRHVITSPSVSIVGVTVSAPCSTFSNGAICLGKRGLATTRVVKFTLFLQAP